MEHDLISIIIPVYNAGEYLYKCIESVIKQTYSRIEILLIDDGSTDNSAEICDSYAKEDVRVRVLHKKNAGVSSARNDGIRLANGMYLAFVDADDYISPEYITTLYNGITTFNVDLAAVGYNRVFVESDKNSEIELCSSPEVLTATKALDQAMDPVIPWVGFAWGKLIKKQVLLDNELEFDADIKLNEDSLFYYRFLDHANTVVKLPQIMYNYLIRADSVTRKATVDYKIQKTKVLAFERAFQIAQKYRNQDGGGILSKNCSYLFCY